ncbi:hypothetical protein BDV93DRAFT_584284 [Ceratobasidium sp. AG-I]|nr:hypothetical protein BDV93DRAFT_584284 [Ceratobasidium sp. AG-I]
MASVPSMYDADLSMQISQHLFDLQLARYIKRTNETHYAIHDEIASAESSKKPSAKRPRVPIDSTFDTEQAVFEAGGSKLADGSDHETSSDGQTARPSSLDPPSATTELLAGVNGIIEQLKVNQDQVDQQLAGMQDKLKDGMKDALEVAAEKITRMMIKLRNHDARGLNAGNDYVYQHIVTEDGEAPTALAVPWATNSGGYQFWDYASETTLAQYLHYYNIGTELVEQGDPPTLKPNSKEQARRILGRLTHSREG